MEARRPVRRLSSRQGMIRDWVGWSKWDEMDRTEMVIARIYLWW